MPKYRQTPQNDHREDGFLLVALIVAIFLILLALSVAAPRIAMQIKRQREEETVHRANQYVRGIQLYYRKFGRYPPSMEALKKSNNQRFLRQEYLDPLTGLADWKIIKAGTNKTTVKGFFGQDLPGLPGGLGAAAGMQSPGSSGGSGSNINSGTGLTGGSGNPSTSPASGGLSNTGTPSGTGTAGVSGTGSGSGPGSQDATSASLASVGPIMGVAVGKNGQAIIVVNEKDQYQEWEFLYDPRIEAMKAKASLLGGGAATSSGSGSLGSAGSLASPSGTSTAPGQTPASNGPGTTTPPLTPP